MPGDAATGGLVGVAKRPRALLQKMAVHGGDVPRQLEERSQSHSSRAQDLDAVTVRDEQIRLTPGDGDAWDARAEDELGARRRMGLALVGGFKRAVEGGT